MSQSIIDRLGLQDLPEETQITLLTKMTESVLKRIAVEALTRLSDADQETLLGFQDRSATPEEVEKFLKEKLPDYEKIQDEVVRAFAEEMRETVAMLKKAV